jgi:hypothetical protein
MTSETPSSRKPNTARVRRCISCSDKLADCHHNTKYCKDCALERRRAKARRDNAKRRKQVPANERTAERSEHRKRQDEEYGRVVYLHRDPLTKQPVYVGSGTFSRAKSCRRGGGFLRSPEHWEWYKTHRRIGTIKTYKDFLEILHRNLPSEAEQFRLEGEETLKALNAGCDLFNKLLPNPKRLNRSGKDIVRHWQRCQITE